MRPRSVLGLRPKYLCCAAIALDRPACSGQDPSYMSPFDLFERFKAIATLTEQSDGTADQFEGSLIEQVRQVGRVATLGWARALEDKVGQEFKDSHPGAQQSKKKR